MNGKKSFGATQYHVLDAKLVIPQFGHYQIGVKLQGYSWGPFYEPYVYLDGASGGCINYYGNK